MTLPPDIHALTGAYVLNALSSEERQLFEQHLAACPSCAQEVAELREATARLGSAVAEPAPPDLRDRVLAMVGHTEQLPADVDPPAATRLTPRNRAARRWVPRLAVPVAAAAIIAAVVFGYQNMATHRQLETMHQVNDSYTALTSLLANPDTRVLTQPISGGGTATVVASPSRGDAMVLANHMPPAPPGRAYQAWVISPDGIRSAGLITQPGPTRPLRADGITPGDKIGVTVEPAGGSPQPTTDPIVVIPVSNT
ncbi:Anti-sigma-K factor RskA [Amycolatopsis arida]|uniref:Regulator of SigK n=1 Tax=Amycolatopsis arida TaxID=587909 RepID=A0A1I5ZDF0_9PSEU|nr:anti-sigma factor [Amycolatopsis arida]TDX89547.1 anti-sigma-K factor RskA [Amycolatopsis arida]SFQ54458.1 Anti-sigma-K factor RskA [Amycolatopsis arida]